MAKSVLGEKTDYSKIFKSGAEGVLKTSFGGIEGVALKALGLGGKKRGEDPGAPLYTKDVGGFGGAGISGDTLKLFDNLNPVPKIGSSNMNLLTKGTSGLMGWLNDQDWAGKLFGGKLFGAGSLFGGGHALGGDVMAGVPIDVGELGRERFTPMVPGRITSNRDMQHGNVFHIDARGTDPALTRENVARAVQMARAQGSHDAVTAIHEQARRRPA
jgi:hypothetical protein